MARFHTVKLGAALYFSKDGTSSSKKVDLSVRGLDRLLQTRRGSIQRDLNNVPYRQQSNFAGKGFDVSIAVETWLPVSVFNSLKAAINSAMENSQTLALEITGDEGVYNLTVIPGEEPIEWNGDFTNSRIEKPIFNFVTT